MTAPNCRCCSATVHAVVVSVLLLFAKTLLVDLTDTERWGLHNAALELPKIFPYLRLSSGQCNEQQQCLRQKRKQEGAQEAALHS
jgi:hypothetical protein